jgi:hypothetical protein
MGKFSQLRLPELPQELIGTMAGVDALIEQMCDRLTLRLDQQGCRRVLLQKSEAYCKERILHRKRQMRNVMRKVQADQEVRQ